MWTESAAWVIAVENVNRGRAYRGTSQFIDACARAFAAAESASGLARFTRSLASSVGVIINVDALALGGIDVPLG
jgi:hypothetical protein